MAGHSQFKNIMHRKNAQDRKRSRLFARLAREITIAVKDGAPDPQHNARLRAAIQEARASNMPKDNIERAIKRGSESTKDNFACVRYEGFGPGGVGIIVEALTDNHNRTASDIRSIFSKNGGSLGETGSVSFMFERLGCIVYPPESLPNVDAALERALTCSAEDCVRNEETGGYTFYTRPKDLWEVAGALEKEIGLEPIKVGLVWRAKTTVPCPRDKQEGLLGMFESLEEHDDVRAIFSNASGQSG